LTALASVQCDHGIDSKDGEKDSKVVGDPRLAKGRALGEFRSAGQLGRAVGPILGTWFPVRFVTRLIARTACASYWTFGPSATYITSAAAMGFVAVAMGGLAHKRHAA
jgi:hypothetical protein